MIMTAIYIVLLFNVEEAFDILEDLRLVSWRQNWQKVGVNIGNEQDGGVGICQCSQKK